MCFFSNVSNYYNFLFFVSSGGAGNFILSSSFVGFTTVYGGVAPMCKNGYGVIYRIQDDE